MMIQLTDQKINTEQVLAQVAHANAGANLLFVGTTRRWTGDVETTELKYETYREMATLELQRICDEAKSRWDLLGICVVHRLGTVPVGEASLAVAVSSSHRSASFESGQWLIENLKKVVPIWKQEVNSQGQKNWVHPDEKGIAK